MTTAQTNAQALTTGKVYKLGDAANFADIKELAGKTTLFLRWKQNKIKDSQGNFTGETTPVRKYATYIEPVTVAQITDVMTNDAKFANQIHGFVMAQYVEFCRESLETEAENSKTWDNHETLDWSFGLQSFVDWFTTEAESGSSSGAGNKLSGDNFDAWFASVVKDNLVATLLDKWTNGNLDTATEAQLNKAEKTAEVFALQLKPIIVQRKDKKTGTWRKVPEGNQVGQFQKLLDLEGVKGEEVTELVRAKLEQIAKDQAELLAGLDDAL